MPSLQRLLNIKGGQCRRAFGGFLTVAKAAETGISTPLFITEIRNVWSYTPTPTIHYLLSNCVSDLFKAVPSNSDLYSIGWLIWDLDAKGNRRVP